MLPLATIIFIAQVGRKIEQKVQRANDASSIACSVDWILTADHLGVRR
jgi:H+/Cl- antiporter ClcA